MTLFNPTIATQALRPRHISDARLWPRTPFLAGPGGVGLALTGLEGILSGLAALWFTRSLPALRDSCKEMDIATTEATDLAQTNIRFVGLFRVMQGVSTFIVGRAAAGLSDLAMGTVKRSMCGAGALLVTGQALLHLVMYNKKDQGKKYKRTIGIHGLIYAGIAVLNVLGVAKKGEPEALKA